MRPTPDRQNKVCPTGCACHAVRAPGVNVTTVPPMRDGDVAVITGSWNTMPVKVSAAPRLVVRAPARMTPALTGMTALLPARRSCDRQKKQEVTIAAAPGGAQSTWMKGHHSVGVKDFALAVG